MGQDAILRRVVNPPRAGYQPARSLPSCPTPENIQHQIFVIEQHFNRRANVGCAPFIDGGKNIGSRDLP